MSFYIPSTQIKLFDNVADFFKAMHIGMAYGGCVGDDEKGGALKKDDLVRATDFAKVVEVGLQCNDVGNKTMNDTCPCLYDSHSYQLCISSFPFLCVYLQRRAFRPI